MQLRHATYRRSFFKMSLGGFEPNSRVSVQFLCLFSAIAA